MVPMDDDGDYASHLEYTHRDTPNIVQVVSWCLHAANIRWTFAKQMDWWQARHASTHVVEDGDEEET